jgi:hypothetical protein
VSVNVRPRELCVQMGMNDRDSLGPMTDPAGGPGGPGYLCSASPGAGKILPYLFTLSIHITPFTVIAKGAISNAQSEKPCKAIAVMAMTRRTNPPLSIALAHTIGFRVMVGGYPVLKVEPTVPVVPKCPPARRTPAGTGTVRGL